MAMTADSSSSSPRGGLNSPQFRRKNLPSPWSQVVRGESESIPAVHHHHHHSPSSPSSTTSPQVTSLPEQTTFSDCSHSKAASSSSSSSSSSPPPDISLAADGGGYSDSNRNKKNNNNNVAAGTKKPAWNKPSNGVVEVDPVMGAASWPALSESAKASPKSLADSSSKTVPDGSLSTSQGPVIPQSTQNQATSNANPNSTPNRTTMSGRQRSSKRGGGGGSSSASGPLQSGFSHQHPSPPPAPPFPVLQMPPNSYGNFVPAMPDPSMRDPQYRGNNWEARPVGGFASQSHNDHRHSSRRGGNYGPRGDGGYHNNFGGRRDQDRGNYGNARDGHMQSQRAPPRGFPRPLPPGAHTFVPPQPVRPFLNSLGYPELIYFPTVPMEPFRGMPLYNPAPPPGMNMTGPELPLPALLLYQIHYYFSDGNLVKDEFLKSNMDDQGWVAISLIAGFPRVSCDLIE
ncbi:hypothetical protein REPUB_Repub19eG0013800 [Reevesia pubescens]